jgi:predicted ArsR family transcriptional regulator
MNYSDSTPTTVTTCPCCGRPLVIDIKRTQTATRPPGKQSQAFILLNLLATTGPMNTGTAAKHLNKSTEQILGRMKQLRNAGLATQVTDRHGQPITAPTPLGGTAPLYQATEAGHQHLTTNRP